MADRSIPESIPYWKVTLSEFDEDETVTYRADGFSITDSGALVLWRGGGEARQTLATFNKQSWDKCQLCWDDGSLASVHAESKQPHDHGEDEDDEDDVFVTE